MAFTTQRVRNDIRVHAHTGIYDGGLIRQSALLNDSGDVLGSSDLPHALLSATHSDSVANAVTSGSLIYGNATPAWDELLIGASNRVLGVSSGAVLEYKDILGTADEIDITHAANSITIGLVNPLILGKGGSGKALTASAGGIVYTDADSMEILAAPAAIGQTLRATSTTAFAWGALDLADTDAVTGTLPVGNGGTGATALTLGSVVFAGASGVYTQDNANLFWDDTNNRLGIRTSTPGYPLDIEGATGLTNVKFGADKPIYIIQADPTIGFNLYYSSDWKFGKGSSASYGTLINVEPSTGHTRFYSSNSGNADATATISNIMTLLQTGKLGIMSASVPTATLTIGSGTPLITSGVAVDVFATNQTLASAIAMANIYSTDAIAADKGGSLGLGGKGGGNPYPFAMIAGRSENNSYAGYFQISTFASNSVPAEALRITSQQLVGVNTTTVLDRLHIAAPNTATSAFAGGISVFSTDAKAADVGGKLTLGGLATSYPNGWPYANIKGGSQNATASDYQGYLAIGVSDINGTIAERARIGQRKVLLDNTVTSLFSIPVASNSVSSACINYTVQVFNGTDLQIRSGFVICYVINKGGVFSNNLVTEFGASTSATSGTLTVTFAITAANPTVVSVSASSSLVTDGTSSNSTPVISYNFYNLTEKTVTFI